MSNPKVHPIDSLSDEAFGWYLSGFVDGEGCFQIRENNRRQRWGRFSARFQITLRSDDALILASISRRLKCGYLNYSESASPKSPNSKPRMHFCVTDIGSLFHVIVAQFRKFPLQAKKARDFEIWSRAIEIMFDVHSRPSIGRGKGNGRGRSKVVFENEIQELIALIAALKSARVYQSSESKMPTTKRPIERPLWTDTLERIR